LIGLHIDARAAVTGAKFNPTLAVPLDVLAINENALLEALTREKRFRRIQSPVLEN
jgi:hypothetical protein